LMESGSPLTTLLTVHRGWDEVYSDQLAQVFVRSQPD
jgi:hypothetical protein